MEANLYLKMLTSEKGGRKKEAERKGWEGRERQRVREDEKVPRLLGNFKIPLEEHFFLF